MIETLSTKLVPLVRPFNWLPRGVLGVKIHGFGVQLFCLGDSDMGSMSPRADTLQSLAIEPLANEIGRKSLRTHFVGVSAALMEAVRKQAVPGADTVITLPPHLFQLRVLNLPWFSADDLALDAETPNFWEEHDPTLTDLDDRIVRFQILYAKENDDCCSVLFASILASDVTRYRSLALDSNLLPVCFENELFAVINTVVSGLSAEVYRAGQMMLYLCPGCHFLVWLGACDFDFETIAISELDEGLLFELSALRDVNLDFWSELAMRLGDQFKVALDTILARRQVSIPSTLILVVEYPNFDHYLKLLASHLGGIQPVPFNALEGLELLPKHEAILQKYNNPGLFASMRGMNIQGIAFGTAGAVSPRPIELNFLPEFPILKRNRQLAICQRLLLFVCLLVGIGSLSWLGFGTMPDWLATRTVSAEYDQKRARVSVEAKRKQANQDELAALTQANNALFRVVTPKSYSLFFEQLPTLVPPDIELTSVHLTESGALKIVGLARDNAALGHFATAFVKNRFSRIAPQTTFARAGAFLSFTLNTTLQQKQ